MGNSFTFLSSSETIKFSFEQSDRNKQFLPTLMHPKIKITPKSLQFNHFDRRNFVSVKHI